MAASKNSFCKEWEPEVKRSVFATLVLPIDNTPHWIIFRTQRQYNISFFEMLLRRFLLNILIVIGIL